MFTRSSTDDKKKKKNRFHDGQRTEAMAILKGRGRTLLIELFEQEGNQMGGIRLTEKRNFRPYREKKKIRFRGELTREEADASARRSQLPY